MQYIDVIVDNNTNATDELYTYRTEEPVQPGTRVQVNFGRGNKLMDAYVVRVLESAPDFADKCKDVVSVEEESLTPEALSTALWMRGRYLCRYIEAVKCFLPGYTQVKRKTKDPFESIEYEPDEAKELTEGQKSCLAAINAASDGGRNENFLLHGVTGSGKTEVYLQAMKRVLDKGRQGIILVPEIALTPQTIRRFINRFGKDTVAVLHSKLTPAQRAVEYKKIMDGSVRLVIGARSAIFAPFRDIGLIVIDEEHESSYKSETAPKYDAIEVAVKRAMSHKCVLVLGSATPGISDYYRSEQGIFTRLELDKRYNETPLPAVRIIDMAKQVRSGNLSLFSQELSDEIGRTLDAKKQVILFLNRRGYSSFVFCRECGYTVTCPECGIAMPYHKEENACVCHYCGRKVPMPKVCPECGSKIIGRYGVGTEQVEEKARELFPGAAIERLDLDSIKKKGELDAVLKRFASGKTDILIGTQLVAKGLDFANVGLVGVISADVTLNIPDFRSPERTFQLLTQAAGRAGRGGEQGLVLIQTYNADSPVIAAAAAQDYRSFYDREIRMRKQVNYPPFCDIFRIVVSDPDKEKAESRARIFAEKLRSIVPADCSVLGPSVSPIHRQNGLSRYQLLVKSPAGMRKAMGNAVQSLKIEESRAPGSAKMITFDINPFSFM